MSSHFTGFCAFAFLSFVCSKLSFAKIVSLNKCVNFVDNRNTTSDEILITIPGNLTNSDETVDFLIGDEYPLRCKSSFTKNISWEHGTKLYKKKFKDRGDRLRNSGKRSSHFTHGGYFHSEGDYYRPSEFCVQSISEFNIELQICSVSCSSSGRICLPKCCGVDEILVYWNFTCRKISSEEKEWNPKIYSKSNHRRRISEKVLADRLHIKRYHPSCAQPHSWPLSFVRRPKPNKPGDPDFPWKLIENSFPIFLRSDRQWLQFPEGEYCVDGFANWEYNGTGNGNQTYLGNPDKFSTILFCPKGNFTAVKLDKPRAWTYSVFLLFFSIFPFLTALIHILLFDKQHLHGLTVLCHAISMFLFYVFLALAHLSSLFDGLKALPFGFCRIVGIATHYFCMTSFTWLSVMNFDLWLTFRSMRPVSKISKRIRRFWLYFGIGWGFPAILITTFCVLDEVYSDITTEVIVPNYGELNCFVAAHARPYYVYSLVAFALGFNTILIFWTFYIFYDFRKQNAKSFSTKRSKSDKYSVRLFIKLFCVMGVAWFVELLSWVNNGERKQWFLVILDLIMFMQAFFIFFIFCINRRTLKQLEEKFPGMRCLTGPLRKLRWFQSPSDGDNCVEMTTPGSTPRKLSLSATTNTKLDSTLPRKTSNSSIRSFSSNKYFPTAGRMETVPLDSEAEAGVCTTESLNVDHAPAPDLLINT